MVQGDRSLPRTGICFLTSRTLIFSPGAAERVSCSGLLLNFNLELAKYIAMHSIHNQIYLSKGFLFFCISITTFLVAAGYFYHLNYLLGLLIALPFLLLAIVTSGRSSRNRTGKHLSILYQPKNDNHKRDDNAPLRIAYNKAAKISAKAAIEDWLPFKRL